jgi:nucleoid-associated protein YgaU
MTVTGEDPVEQHVEPIPVAPADRSPLSEHPERPAIDAVCPYLLAASRGWRSTLPHRDHRCTAVDPAAVLSTDKQRRLCLTLAHQTCPTFGAARAARAAAIAPGVDPAVLAAVESARRPVARSTPVILEQPSIISMRTGWPLDRAVSQVALVGLMVVAFALVVIARLAAGDGGAPSSSPSPGASGGFAAGSPSATPFRTPSPSPSGLGPSQSLDPAASPSRLPGRTTYTVRSGDTLVGIAARFGTTTSAIKKLNHLSSSTLHVGQKLKIP